MVFYQFTIKFFVDNLTKCCTEEYFFVHTCDIVECCTEELLFVHTYHVFESCTEKFLFVHTHFEINDINKITDIKNVIEIE